MCLTATLIFDYQINTLCFSPYQIKTAAFILGSMCSLNAVSSFMGIKSDMLHPGWVEKRVGMSQVLVLVLVTWLLAITH